MLNFSNTYRSVLGKGIATFATALVLAGPVLAADYTLSVNTALATNDPLYKGLEALQGSCQRKLA